MSKQPVNFTTSAQGGLDLDDLFIRRELFTLKGLWLWGRNNYGQLGDNTSVDKSNPVQTVSKGTNWRQISTANPADGHTAAIKTDGTLWLWGLNNNGQLGDNSRTSRSSPVQTVAGGTNWKQVSAGSVNTAGIKSDGTLWTWGVGGAIGDNTTTAKSSPVQTVAGGTDWKRVSVGGTFMGAIKTDGSLWMWGTNTNSGQLGTGNISARSSPVQTISRGNDWKQLSCSTNHTGAIKIDGSLWMWGLNSDGRLGDNGTTSRSSPVQTVSAGFNWAQVSCGDTFTAAIKTDGTLWLWGNHNPTYGNLGINFSGTGKSSPVQILTGGTNWKYVDTGYLTSAAIKTDGTLWCWGFGSQGQLGDNGTTSRSSPVQTTLGGTNWKQVSAGNAIIAIREND